MTSPDFDVRLAGDGDVEGVLTALSNGYGRTFTRDWFRWKHTESPWGRSRCWIAEDSGGFLGVVFGLPWRVRTGNTEIPVSRLVDGATTVRAQRRGVFRRVVAAELQAAAPSRGMVIATATPEARDAHVKNGAIALEPIASQHRAVLWRPAAVETTPVVYRGWQPPDHGDALHTHWDDASLQWRLDPRAGIDYLASRLVHADDEHGVVHRVAAHRGVRSLVVTAQWGSAVSVARLISALALRAKALTVLAPTGHGAVARPARLAVTRGSSLLCVWAETDALWASSARRLDDWALDGLTLEGVV